MVVDALKRDDKVQAQEIATENNSALYSRIFWDNVVKKHGEKAHQVLSIFAELAGWPIEDGKIMPPSD